MRLPKMRPQAASTINITDFSGGLNLRDGTSEILDNQLTDTKNMWWKDGVLKSRPELKLKDSALDIVPSSKDWENVAHNIKKHDVFCYDDTYGSGRLCSSHITYDTKETDDTESVKCTAISFWWVYKNGVFFASRLYLDGQIDGYFVVQKGDTVYLFSSNQKIYSSTLAESWEEVEEKGMYVPILVTNCKAKGMIIDDYPEYTFEGTQIEGYNLLTNRYRMIYSVFNENNLTGNSGEHDMVYPLLHDIRPIFANANDKGYVITAKITDLEGNIHEHAVKIQGSVNMEENPSTDNLYMRFWNNQIVFYTETDGKKQFAKANEKAYGKNNNNLEITACYDIPEEERQKRLKKIFNMTRAEWFGGASSGLAGGTRLFLCGNTEENEKSLVCWSGLNDPLYFPENNYFYVGNSSSAVTGFGKQSDKLVIFKENETWYTQYYQNTDISATDLINQSVVDFSASSVFFPLVQINPNIGCPYPDTVQLCRNRLVWLSDGGNVYTLVSENQYNERSIYPVSEMVQSRLKGEAAASATACDWDGYYLLSFGDRHYLMDYNNYGYTHIASHSKTEDANLRIPWYCWETRAGGERSLVMSISDSLVVAKYLWGGGTERGEMQLAVFDPDNADEPTEGCESTVTTKLFNFSVPHYRKNIERIDLSLGNNGGEPITVEIITDCGNETHILEMQSPQTENRQAGYIQNRAVLPGIRHISRMAVRLSCSGPLIIDGMIIKYRITGGVR